MSRVCPSHWKARLRVLGTELLVINRGLTQISNKEDSSAFSLGLLLQWWVEVLGPQELSFLEVVEGVVEALQPADFLVVVTERPGGWGPPVPFEF